MTPASVALSSYQLALALRTPAAFEAAAHALARAVRADTAPGLHTPAAALTGPRLVVDNDRIAS